MITSGTLQGPRSYQEDRYYSWEPIPGLSTMMVADGHGGPECAEYVKQYFSKSIAVPPINNFSMFISILAGQVNHYRSGSTLSCVLVRDNIAHIAIIGDSPVIVIDNNGSVHRSPEHNIRTNQKEADAAIARGGVISGGYLFKGWSNDGLQMARALGDRDLQPIVISEPEIYSINDPAIILVASDGLFDPNHYDTTNSRFLIPPLKDGATANDLLSLVEKQGLHDNATAIVWRKE